MAGARFEGAAAVYAGGSWAAWTPLEINGGSTAVSCPSASFCMAVGESGQAWAFSAPSTGTGTTKEAKETPTPPSPQPNSGFAQARAPIFNSKTGNLQFYFKVANAGVFRWRLSFKKCKAGDARRRGRCARVLVPFAAGSQAVSAGSVEIKAHAGRAAAAALRAGRALRVSGTFVFQSSLGGPPVSHTVSAVVRPPKKRHAKR
jgi:hypothetical protein